MKRFHLLSAAICISVNLIVLVIAAPSSAVPIDRYLWGSNPPNFTDAEKNSGSSDDKYCWAAAASNVLEWGGWDAGFSGEDQIFNEFKSYWSPDYGSWSRFGWEWWFSGSVTADWAWTGLQPDSSDYDPHPNAPNGYYTKTEYDDNLRVWESQTPSNDFFSDADNQIKAFVDDGYGTTMSVNFYDGNSDDPTGSHAITLWGYQYDDVTGDILGIHFTDSDDRESSTASGSETAALNELIYRDIFFSSYFDSWYIDSYGSQPFNSIGFMSGLLPNTDNGDTPPIPEPGTMVLVATGLLGLAGIRNKLKTE